MTSRLSLSNFAARRTGFALLIGWMVLVTVYGYATVAAKMALPPSADVYARTVEFQALMFLIFKLPPLIVVFMVVLAFRAFFRHARQACRNLRFLRLTFGVGIAITTVGLLRFIYFGKVDVNPWFQHDEQLVLHFMLIHLPVYAALIGLALASELWWLESRAS